MTLLLLGSIAIAPIAREHWVSVSARQVVPPSSVFQTPPLAAPM